MESHMLWHTASGEEIMIVSLYLFIPVKHLQEPAYGL